MPVFISVDTVTDMTGLSGLRGLIDWGGKQITLDVIDIFGKPAERLADRKNEKRLGEGAHVACIALRMAVADIDSGQCFTGRVMNPGYICKRKSGQHYKECHCAYHPRHF